MQTVRFWLEDNLICLQPWWWGTFRTSATKLRVIRTCTGSKAKRLILSCASALNQASYSFTPVFKHHHYISLPYIFDNIFAISRVKDIFTQLYKAFLAGGMDCQMFWGPSTRGQATQYGPTVVCARDLLRNSSSPALSKREQGLIA